MTRRWAVRLRRRLRRRARRVRNGERPEVRLRSLRRRAESLSRCRRVPARERWRVTLARRISGAVAKLLLLGSRKG